MQVTHFGHSCVLLDTGAARLLIDPGTFSTGFEDVTGLDAVLVTHQHPDHLDPDRLPALLRANPDARLIVDGGTAGQLGGVDHESVEPGATVTIAGARVEVLFLPTAAPWQKLSEAVTYLREVAPRTAVPIHQGILAVPGMYYGHFERLGPQKTTVRVLDPASPTTL